MASIAQPSPAAQARVWAWAAALALSCVLMAAALRGVEWTVVGRAFARADAVRVAAALGLGSVGLFLRAVRWRGLLAAARPVRTSDSFWAYAAGFLGNQALPARAGELLRCFGLRRRTGLPLAFVAATVGAERILDLLVLAGLAAALLPLATVRSDLLRAAVWVSLGAGGAAAAVLTLLARRGLRPERFLPRSAATRVAPAWEQATAGLRLLSDRRRLLQFALLTLPIWFGDAVATSVLAGAMGFPLPPAGAILLLAALGISSAIPSAPGGLGTVQLLGVLILPGFGIARSDALAFGLMFQVMNLLSATIWGAPGVWRCRKDAN